MHNPIPQNPAGTPYGIAVITTSTTLSSSLQDPTDQFGIIANTLLDCLLYPGTQSRNESKLFCPTKKPQRSSNRQSHSLCGMTSLSLVNADPRHAAFKRKLDDGCLTRIQAY